MVEHRHRHHQRFIDYDLDHLHSEKRNQAQPQRGCAEVLAEVEPRGRRHVHVGISVVHPLEPTVVEEPDGATTEEYEIRGTVTAIDREDPSVTLDHEEIARLMKAMTMKFQVADPETLEGIEEGDEVQGQLVERDGQYVITDVRERRE